jgi:hypothetical protein
VEKSARDEAIERVGRALYGELWIGELGTRDRQHVQSKLALHDPLVFTQLIDLEADAAF